MVCCFHLTMWNNMNPLGTFTKKANGSNSIHPSAPKPQFCLCQNLPFLTMLKFEICWYVKENCHNYGINSSSLGPLKSFGLGFSWLTLLSLYRHVVDCLLGWHLAKKKQSTTDFLAFFHSFSFLQKKVRFTIMGFLFSRVGNIILVAIKGSPAWAKV